MSRNINYFSLSILFFTICVFSSCKKLIEIDSPVSQPDAAAVYQSNGSAIAVMSGLYSSMNSNTGFVTGQGGLSVIAGLSADELQGYPSNTPVILQAYTNSLKSTSRIFWTPAYNYIYTVNAVLQGLSSSTGVSKEVKQQLTGEAKFMRAFFYFYLVNLFGDVPLITTTDYTVNAVAARTPKSQIYVQIIQDLKDAQTLLSSDYVGIDLTTPSGERVRPTVWAADALLARVYLYNNDWVNAEAQATAVINNNMFSLTDDLNGVFLANSTEAIWQLQPVLPEFNTLDAPVFILTGPPSLNNSVSVSDFLINSFEPGDQRMSKWIGIDSSTSTKYYYPFKYKVNQGVTDVTEYLMMLRLAEQYLIRAEARIQQGNIAEATSDLNAIRTRAGLTGTPFTSQENILNAIQHERQVELFTELGQRWLDLKRTNSVDSVMSVVTPLKGGTWSPDWKLYPIPLATIQADQHLTQNTGY